MWVECVKDLLANVCYGTAKSVEIGSGDIRVSTGQYTDSVGGRIPLYIPVWMCGRSFSGGLFPTQPSQTVIGPGDHVGSTGQQR